MTDPIDYESSLTGEIVDETPTLTLEDVCRVCDCSTEYVFDLMAEGIIDPGSGEPIDWRFSAITLRRVRRVTRMTRDLRLNLAGAALVLQLLDDIDRLRTRLRQAGLMDD